MSNDILKEDFFGTKRENVSDGELVGFVALYLGGTYDKNAISEVDGSKSFFSKVYDGKGGNVPVVYTHGRPESLSKMGAMVVLHAMGFDKIVDSEKFLNRSYSNAEVLSKLEDFYRTIPNIDKNKFPENFNTLRLPNIEAYCDVLKNTNPYLAENLKVLDKLKSDAIEFGTAKPSNSSEKDVETAKK